MVFRKFLRALLVICLFAAAGIFIINLYVVLSVRGYVYSSIEELPARSVVMVLGSQIYSSGGLSQVLQDRVDSGIEIAGAKAGRKLLLTGDHGEKYYDEVNTMRRYVLAHSEIPGRDIFMDHAGFNTHASMYRARDVFEVKELIVVTQEFHISRAVYIARKLGLDAVGLAVDQGRFSLRLRSYWELREVMARVKAFFWVLFKVKPRYLGKVIPITGDGRASWE